MVGIIVVSVLGILLAGCSNSSRLEDILRANSRPQSTKQRQPQSPLNNGTAPEAETRIAPEATPEEPPTSTVRSPSEE
jgi:hypothetical protein